MKVKDTRHIGALSVKMKYKVETLLTRIGYFHNFRIKNFILQKPFKDELVTEESDKLEIMTEILKINFIHTLTLPIYDQQPLTSLFELFVANPNRIENIKLKLF